MNIKKFLCWVSGIAVAILLTVLAITYNRNKNVPDNVQPTFTEYLVEDFNYAHSFDTDSVEVRFYEVDAILNGNLDTLSADEVKILSTMTVFTVYDTVYFLTRTYETGETVIEKKEGMWLGSDNLTDVNVNITFKDAVDRLYKFGTIPSGDKMVFRCPIDMRDAYDPLYIFGTHSSGFVAVDSRTGHTYEIE